MPFFIEMNFINFYIAIYCFYVICSKSDIPLVTLNFDFQLYKIYIIELCIRFLNNTPDVRQLSYNIQSLVNSRSTIKDSVRSSLYTIMAVLPYPTCSTEMLEIIFRFLNFQKYTFFLHLTRTYT